MVFDHTLNVQLLEKDRPVQIYKRMAQLMREVVTPESNALMDTASSRVPPLSLCPRQCFLIGAKESRVVNLLACRKRSEVRQPNVDADRIIILWQGFGRAFHREACIPLARRRACDSQRLNLTFNGAVQLDLHVPDFRQTQFAVPHRETRLSVGERIVPLARPETRKARFAVAPLYSAKECLKGFIEPVQNVLQYLTVNLVKLRTYLFDCRQLVGLLNVSDRFSFKPVCISPLLKSRIIEFAAKRKGTVQACGLRLAWIDSKLESSLCYSLFSHARHAYSVSCIGESRNAVDRSVSARLHYSTGGGANLQAFTRFPQFIPAMNPITNIL